MIQETMTIHKALSEVKILNNRISQKISVANFATANKVSNKRIGGKEIADWTEDVKSSWESINALIARRCAIKRAVNKSNAETQIQLTNGTYSIAEAIEMKQHGIQFYEALLNKLRSDYASANTTTERGNCEADEKATKYANDCVGSDKTTSAKEIESVRVAYYDSHKWDLLDPIGVTDKISELEKFIDSFKSEIDSCISVSNAITVVDINY